MAALVADLDRDTFAVREKASQELEKLGESVVGALRAKLADRPALELRQRLERLLDKFDGKGLSAEQLRAVRAVQVLEHMGTAEAKSS